MPEGRRPSCWCWRRCCWRSPRCGPHGDTGSGDGTPGRGRDLRRAGHHRLEGDRRHHAQGRRRAGWPPPATLRVAALGRQADRGRRQGRQGRGGARHDHRGRPVLDAPGPPDHRHPVHGGRGRQGLRGPRLRQALHLHHAHAEGHLRRLLHARGRLHRRRRHGGLPPLQPADRRQGGRREGPSSVTASPSVAVAAPLVRRPPARLPPAVVLGAGTKVTARASTSTASRAAPGVYGKQPKTVHFTVGRSQVSVVDAAKHTMKVYRDGKLIKTIPISSGAPAPHHVQRQDGDRREVPHAPG